MTEHIRHNYSMRELVERLAKDLAAGRIDRQLAAHRMYWHGVPFEVALRVIAHR